MLTAYCVNRCTCPWNKKRAKRVECACGKNVCSFKIVARKLKGEETIQIRSHRLKHNCRFQNWNRKVTYEFLADRYLETWRFDPIWHLVKGFGAATMIDFGVQCGYYKLWYARARARAKYILYGDGEEQYKRVWDYVHAIKRYCEGSMAICFTESIKRPPPIFQRMFICLKPVLEGFMVGCRPIIGLDGCHLTGSYQGFVWLLWVPMEITTYIHLLGLLLMWKRQILGLGLLICLPMVPDGLLCRIDKKVSLKHSKMLCLRQK